MTGDLVTPVYIKKGVLMLLDQRKLPGKETYLKIVQPGQLINAIQSLAVRGAPAIGVAAALGLSVFAKRIRTKQEESFLDVFTAIAKRVADARPTAVNLGWAVDRILAAVEQAKGKGVDALIDAIAGEARKVFDDEVESCRRISEYGEKLIADGSSVLTHCNAGAIATGGLGTALGMVTLASRAGKRVRVYADETRPLLQGNRLTSWEMVKLGINVLVIPDGASGSLMQRGLVDCVVVGADRIARNGDTANKIGTYMAALAAHDNRVPFYVAAPFSTIDMNCAVGADIPIEERDPKEVLNFGGKRIAARGAGAMNPAFDVTPARLITAIITDKGVVYPPYELDKV